MIEIKDLQTGFSAKTVSRSLSLKIESGSFVCLIGPNGCGKTTLLRTIAGLLPAKKGDIFINGKSLRQYSSKELARNIAYLPQVREIPDITVDTLVSHGRFPYLGFSRKLGRTDHEKIKDALKLSNAGRFAEKRLKELSGGERQQAYLAMTIAQDTPILLLDEPGTYLDISNRFSVMETALKLNRKGITVLMTLHDLSEAMWFSPMVCLMDTCGSLRFSGTPQALYDSGLLQEIFDVSVAKTDFKKKLLCLSSER